MLENVIIQTCFTVRGSSSRLKGSVKIVRKPFLLPKTTSVNGRSPTCDRHHYVIEYKNRDCQTNVTKNELFDTIISFEDSQEKCFSISSADPAGFFTPM